MQIKEYLVKFFFDSTNLLIICILHFKTKTLFVSFFEYWLQKVSVKP